MQVQNVWQSLEGRVALYGISPSMAKKHPFSAGIAKYFRVCNICTTLRTEQLVLKIHTSYRKIVS